MRLTQHVDYGLRVLMYLASRPGEYATSAELAKVFRVSHNHLLKVVHRLCELGYVDAKRGPTGGVSFRPSTADVTVGEVVRHLEPQHALVECFDPAVNTCPITRFCGLAPLLKRANDAFLRELDRTTLGELATPPGALRSIAPRRRAQSSA
ncbi:MAG: Rrf2 family transcriptional regulator [Thermodesulfobacteriota bacterium]